jgi:flagellar motor switch protein FliM
MLNQAEIDALLAGKIELGEDDENQAVNLAKMLDNAQVKPTKSKKDTPIRPYNFWSPDRFSQEQMRAFSLMHETLAERLSTSLPPFLRANLKPRLIHTEQGRFHDLMRDLPRVVHTEQGRLNDLMGDVGPGELFHLISLPPLPGQMVVTISPKINYIILEQRLGSHSESVHEQGDLTEIDINILSGMAEHILSDIQAAWSNVVPVEPRLEESTTNFHWIQMSMGNERVILTAIELRLEHITGTMNLYLPFSMVKPIAHLLKPQTMLSKKKDRRPQSDEKINPVERLNQMILDVSVNLGDADLTMGELANLQPGDLITLNSSPKQELPVKIVDRTRFHARAGRVGRRVIAQILNKVDPQEQSFIH